MQNHVSITGYLCPNLERKKFVSFGGIIKQGAYFVLAVPRDHKNRKTGEEMIDHFDCITWGAEAENVAMLGAGSLLSVEGRLQMESCEESDGTAHEKLRIYVKKVYILQQKQELPVITISGLNDSDELPF